MAGVPKSELAVESRLLMHRATWCGVVFALAVLITVLNIFPTFPVQYEVRSEIVVSAASLVRLQEHVRDDRIPINNGQSGVRLRAVRVLDRSSRQIERPAAAAQDLLLVEVESLWDSRCSESSHKNWLLEVTRLDEQSLEGTEVARQERLARWNLDVAKHYAARHEFLANTAPSTSSDDGRTFELARSTTKSSSAKKGVPASLASYGSGGGPAANNDSSQDVMLQLEEQVRDASQTVGRLELEWQEQIDQASGTMEVAVQPEIGTRTASVPTWMAASVLVLGLASGSLAGWFQYRLQSGGVYDASRVADQLELEGVPVVGSISLPSDQADQTDWIGAASRRASEASRRTGRNLTRISEWVLGFWVLFIAMRILTDSMWRGVLLDSPLAGLARLISGLP